ncbi:hypothetical protein AJ88_05075 [Mesorhizobium amorphae CCBAU 01583]|nr:hypothetical protein AJ88_05075 [Mesorhizobium amorphae CCBAU 01583]
MTGKRLTLSFSAEQNGFAHDQPSIVVIDHHPLWRSCLARILRGEFQEFAILEIETAHQWDSVVGKQISLVALNIGSSTITDERVLENLACLRRSLREGYLVLLTEVDEATISDAMISELTRYGVRGYITASASVEIALAAFRLVMAGGIYFPRSVSMDCSDWTPVSPENIVALQPAATMIGMAPETPAIVNKPALYSRNASDRSWHPCCVACRTRSSPAN